MRRAAEEKARTVNVWRRHLWTHRETVACVCELQIGRFRKSQRIGGCGKPRCWVCHSEKLSDEHTLQQLRSAETYVEGLTEAALRSDSALERTVSHRGALCLCESASWPAAQHGR